MNLFLPVEHLVIFKYLSQSETTLRTGELGQVVQGGQLCQDVSLVLQLVLPLVLQLADVTALQQKQIRIYTHPQNWRILDIGC